MKFDCYLSITCGAEEGLKKNISEALALENIKAEVNFYRITDTEADDLGLKGSPSVLINGEDIQPSDLSGFS